MTEDPSTRLAQATDHQDAENFIYRAFQLMIAVEEAHRAPTDDELEELFYCLTFACVKLKKLPGGTEAAQRVRSKAEAELAKRRRLNPTTLAIVDETADMVEAPVSTAKLADDLAKLRTESDLAYARGKIEGMTEGVERMRREITFWKAQAEGKK